MSEMGKKRVRPRVPKEKRQNLKNWAEGARETVLLPHVEPYADAVEKGWRAERDYFARVCNEFHARISWELLDHEEPPLPLASFDPNKRIARSEDLPEAQEEVRAARLEVVDKRIRRWLKYRVKRLRKHVRTRVDSSKDPWAILLAKLSGVSAPPKARQAYQQFMREDFAEKIEPVVEERWAESSSAGSSVPVDKEPNAPFRAKVARDLFAELSEEEQEGYRGRAKDEAASARAAYDRALKEPPSKTPQARNAAIENIGAFVAPILQGIHERTGLHSVLILGGPMPKYGGDLRTIHVSYGRNRSAVGSHFPQYSKERFNGVLALMKEYLETVFSKQDCVDAALPGGLEGAKFTISSDSGDESSGESSDSNDDSEDEEEKTRARKKTKTSKGDGAGVGVKDLLTAPAQDESAKKGSLNKHKAVEEEASGVRKRQQKGSETTSSEITAAPSAHRPVKGTTARRQAKKAAAVQPASPLGDGLAAPHVQPPIPPATSQPGVIEAAVPPTTAGQNIGTVAPQAPPSPTTTAGQKVSTVAPQAPPTPPATARPNVGTVDSAAPPAPFEFSADAPTWLRENVRVLSHLDLGCHYRALVETLIRLEHRFGFTDNPRTGITRAARPDEVSHWIGVGRGLRQKGPYDAEVKNLELYAKRWQAWWDSLQPDWRTRADNGSWSRPEEYGDKWDWDALWFPGQNGCVSIVASLYFWGTAKAALGGDGVWAGENRLRWEESVTDVLWMMEGLEHALPAPKKTRGRRA
ncbi:hypothetical protein C8R43DRAFT_1143284 [Mycena crocata]|nr:hypothetical protein C8R43DRAFT_1143284 [Mycena crocata]